MSQINVNRIKDSNKGAPDFPSGVNVGGITSTVTLGVTNLNPTNVNVSGVVTATTLDGNLLATGTPTLGLGVTINASGLNISGVATAGIVSATTLYGDGTNLTGIALTLAPLNYNPAVNSQASHIAKASGIGLTFNQGVKAGSGNVTLSLANAGVAGTVVENFGVGNSVSYSAGPYGTVVTITPTADLTAAQDYHLSYPSGAFTNIGGDVSFVGTAYTFKGRDLVEQMWMVGANTKGQLGQNSTTDYSSPVQIPGSSWTKFSMGNQHAWATKTDGTLWAWGDNGSGRLGLNSDQAVDISSPTQVPGTTWNNVISAAYTSSYAVKTDGTLWSMGSNYYGQLGLNQGQPTNVSSPTQIGSGTDWSKVTSGLYSVYAVKTNGTLWAWGLNNTGRLGLNDLAWRSSPAQIPGTTWTTKIDQGHSVMVAIKSDNTMWAVGENENGQSAQNDTVRRSSPVQIPGTWSDVDIGKQNCYAYKTDGTLWSWGYNYYGELGQNQGSESGVKSYSSPVQIPGTTWTAGSGAGNQCAAVVKTDGTLWAWGYNGKGTLGQNNRTNYSSPTQIPGTTWSKAYSSHSPDSSNAMIITKQV
jgi:alpha-tubulin suppressor-like RCC1 family protein